MKLYVSEFRTDKGFARKDAFRFAQSNGINQKFSVIKKITEPGLLKNSENQPNFEYCFLPGRIVSDEMALSLYSKDTDLDKSRDVSACTFCESKEFFTGRF